MTEKRITVDLTVERVTYTQIARDPDMHGGLGMLLTVAVRGDGPGDPPVIIGFSREAARTIYEAFLENPPPPNRTLPHRH